MDLNGYMAIMRPAIENELEAAVNLSSKVDDPDMLEMVRYHMGWSGAKAVKEAQGKRIRPILLLLTVVVTKGDWKKALPAAAGVELLHNFSLVHDDIEDASDLRHGRPTLWKKWGAPLAINTGDAIYSMAYQSILQLDQYFPAEVCNKAVKILVGACQELTYGQHLDISFEKALDLDLEGYWPMVRGKTGALLAACSQLGGLLSGVNQERLEHLQQFGYSLGYAFQILDDILGIWGEETLIGKSAESDLVSGKKTLPILYGLKMNGEFADLWKRGSVAHEDAKKAADLLESDGAKAFAIEQANHYTNLAIYHIDAAIPNQLASKPLKELADLLLRRNY